MIIFLLLMNFVHRINFFYYNKHYVNVLSKIFELGEENEWTQKVLGLQRASKKSLEK